MDKGTAAAIAIAAAIAVGATSGAASADALTRHVATMPSEKQAEIAEALHRAGIGGDDFERAMNSRLCDLEDTIDIEEWR